MRRDFLHKHTTGFNAGIILKKKYIEKQTIKIFHSDIEKRARHCCANVTI